MNRKINQLIENNLGRIIDTQRDRLLMTDDVYKQDSEEYEKLHARYEALELKRSDRLLINDLIALLESRDSRSSDLAYLAGASDAIKLLHELDIIKPLEE